VVATLARSMASLSIAPHKPPFPAASGFYGFLLHNLQLPCDSFKVIGH